MSHSCCICLQLVKPATFSEIGKFSVMTITRAPSPAFFNILDLSVRQAEHLTSHRCVLHTHSYTFLLPFPTEEEMEAYQRHLSAGGSVGLGTQVSLWSVSIDLTTSPLIKGVEEILLCIASNGAKEFPKHGRSSAHCGILANSTMCIMPRPSTLQQTISPSFCVWHSFAAQSIQWY